MPLIINIATYQFAQLEDLKDLRARLLALCKDWGLKGTILLSVEGINLFVAGGKSEIDWLITELRAIPGLQTLAPKFSESEEQPFSRMLVRIKKEIIAFGVEGIEPAVRTSPKLQARELKQWLDEGRQVTLLDTRNDYEVKQGTFRGAKVLEIDHFKEFPAAVSRLPEDLKQTPIVMFCTGGIRCEKAGPYMEREGFQQIFQLDGGILKYFEEVGGAHYDGECFVFDQRVGVDPALQETLSAICFVCQTPLNEEEQKDVRFVVNVSCPFCYKNNAEQMADNIALHHAAMQECTNPLPGSVPYLNERPLNIPEQYDGCTLLESLAGIFPHDSSITWAGILAQGRYLTVNREIAFANRIVRTGERYLRITEGLVEPAVNPNIRILHEDEALVVLEKPAPLPMRPSGRFDRNTLQFILQQAYAPHKVQAAHWLDANTTGLVVCTKTRHFAKLFQTQFTLGQVEKNYLARVQGHPLEHDFCRDIPISVEAGFVGARKAGAKSGLMARITFSVLHRFTDGSALLEARPPTGRTNQIRVHLWKLGFPICDDATYLPNDFYADTETLPIDSDPLCLHLWKLTFRHPLTNIQLTFEASRPSWAS